MNPQRLLLVLLASLPLAFTGCVSEPPPPPRPQVTYPVTYQIQVGSTQVRSTDGPQNLSVGATQDISVEPGKTFYYQVVSPVEVVLDVYDVASTDALPAGTRTALGRMQGSSFTSSILPRNSLLRFVFSAAHPNTNGTVKFTLSDQPIAPAVMPVP